jgi:protein TonB
LALGASFAVHAALLTVRLVDPQDFTRIFEDTPLEVILVNAHSDEKPEKAKAIAQRSLAGGGETETGRATSPLPPSAFTADGLNTEQVTASKLKQMQDLQNLLLSNLRAQLAALPPPSPKQLADRADAREQEEKRKQLSKLLAEIERRINSENARPKKRYISPSAREEVYAAYYDNLRRRIEDRGTENFPTFNGHKMYGELTMIVTVNHTGQVLNTEIVESSGSALLDRRAAAIARGAGPFGLFTHAMRRQFDQILVVSRFKFTRDETLEAKVSSGP